MINLFVRGLICSYFCSKKGHVATVPGSYVPSRGSLCFGKAGKSSTRGLTLLRRKYDAALPLRDQRLRSWELLHMRLADTSSTSPSARALQQLRHRWLPLRRRKLESRQKSWEKKRAQAIQKRLEVLKNRRKKNCARKKKIVPVRKPLEVELGFLALAPVTFSTLGSLDGRQG